MTTEQDIARIVESVKASAQERLAKLIATEQEPGEVAGLRGVEVALWREHVLFGQTLLAVKLTEECRRCTERDLERRGLSWEDVRVRNDVDYWYRLTTTFGPVFFPLFAYREQVGGVWVTRAPARQLFPLYRGCRSSELCLEWETRLGKEFPFRHAERMLSFFTHGAVALEDTTIAAHMTAVGKLVDPAWLYRSSEDIRTILRERATLDGETGRPLIYFSTDAHALRRFVDDSWAAAWKMANGLRLWCVDRRTGAVIHLGGEYTWGDCNAVAAIVDRLIATGILPPDADYGDGMRAQLVVVTDGLEWIESHVLPRLPWAVVILDIYHVLEHLAEFAAVYFGRATDKARRWLARAKEIIFGRRPAAKRERQPKSRRGQPRRRRAAQAPSAGPPTTAAPSSPEVHAGDALLLELLATHSRRKSSRHHEAFDSLLRYLKNNTHRTDYRRYRARGFQIGSGAMESLHRTASQIRLKIPGPGWLAENAEAIFNLRMLDLVGHWDKFWARPDLATLLTQAFHPGDRPAPEADLSSEEKLVA